MRTAAAILFSVVALLCLVVVCVERQENTPPSLLVHPPETHARWTLDDLRTIEERLKAGKIQLAEAASLAQPILTGDPVVSLAFANTPGENDRHRAIHFVMTWVEQHERWPEFLQQYEEATGCRYLFRGAYDKLP